MGVSDLQTSGDRLNRPALDAAFAAARDLHQHPDLIEFAEFPQDITNLPVQPHHIPAADRMMAETCFDTGPFADQARALMTPWKEVVWRETYRGTHLYEDYLQRFACYKLIGQNAPFVSQQMGGFLLYATANLDYPWHHHPAEELYLILGGAAEFQAEGEAERTLRPGDTIFHTANQPHRMTTFDQPVLCWVVWRPPHMDVKPVLTERKVRA